MDDIYFGFEMTLLTLLVARISLLKFREHWSFDSNEIELFFLICFVNQVWGYFNDDNVYFLHFFHCVAPVVLTLSILKRNVKLIFRFSLLLLVSLNLYCHNLYLIIFSYLFCFMLLVKRAVGFSLKSKKLPRSSAFVHRHSLCTLTHEFDLSIGFRQNGLDAFAVDSLFFVYYQICIPFNHYSRPCLPQQIYC